MPMRGSGIDFSKIHRTLKQGRLKQKRKEDRESLESSSLMPPKTLIAMSQIRHLTDKNELLDAVFAIYNEWSSLSNMSNETTKATTHTFWSKLQQIVPAAADIKDFPTVLCDRRQNLKRKRLNRMGLNRNGKVREHWHIGESEKFQIPL
jgi:hypothetical protein